MKTTSLLALLAALACAVPASAAIPEPPRAAERVRCLADRLVEIDAAAVFIEEKSWFIGANLRTRSDPVMASLEAINRETYEIRERALHREITSPAELEARLAYASAGLDQLHAHVITLIHELRLLGDPDLRGVAAEMAQRIDAVRKVIPADEPPRGCPVVASSGR